MSNINARDFRGKINVDGLVEVIMNSENGIAKLNSLISKLIRRIELLENEHFKMKKVTKLIHDMYDVLREMDVRLSASNDCVLPTLNVDAKKREKIKFVLTLRNPVQEVKD